MLENFQWVFGDDNCIFGDQLRAGAGFDAVLIKNIQRLYEAAWEVMTSGRRLYKNSDHLFFSHLEAATYLDLLMVRHRSSAISDETPKAETKPSQNKVISVTPVKLIFSEGGNGSTSFD